MHLWVTIWVELGTEIEKWIPFILVALCWDSKRNKSKHSTATEANLSGRADAAYMECMLVSILLFKLTNGMGRLWRGQK